ncbi:MAG: molybdopterin-dependent oxidoreductase [Gemmataceae bacterium]
MGRSQRDEGELSRFTRRKMIQLTAGAAAGLAIGPDALSAADLSADCARACGEALKGLEYLTPPAKFFDVSRGHPVPHSLDEVKRREVGLTPETWKLEVVADPATKAIVENPLSLDAGSALDWKALMKLAEKHAVSFMKIMTCNNLGRPLGMGLWEGVPLRAVFWLAKPKLHVRRVVYHGYHNDDPKQMFRSSLPVGRVLEDPPGLPPVILCYKLNGQPLTPQRGGPVRLVVPEMYGYKSIKWLSRVLLTDLPGANDTYAEQDNDVDSWLKTFAGILTAPERITAGETIPLTGYAQVGISGLTKVQTWIAPKAISWPADDPYFTKADWKDAEILPAPKTWGGGLPGDRLPEHLFGFDQKSHRPREWPPLFAMAHWAAARPGLRAGEYVLRVRTIDAKGIAQPMPRPFQKSGRNLIEARNITVT